MIEKGAPRPAAIIGMPVGFVGAAEFEGSAGRKPARHPLCHRARTHGRQRHDRRRRQRSREARPLNMHAKTGRLIGVGTGPGDPELLTLKAVRALEEADVVAYFAKRGSNGNARGIVGPHFRETWIELPLIYPVTTEIDKDSKDYREAIARLLRGIRSQGRTAPRKRQNRRGSLGGRPAFLRILHAPACQARRPLADRGYTGGDGDVGMLVADRRRRSSRATTS